MKLDGRRTSSNVDDRRGKSSGKMSFGIGGTIVVGLIIWLLGGNPLDFVSQQMMDNGSAIENYSPTGNSMGKFFRLTSTMGKGESACMVYCKEHNDVLGSSNIKDIQSYCKKNGITYLTTLDFLYYAYTNKIMTQEECNQFISEVKSKGSKLPANITDITHYKCTVYV